MSTDERQGKEVGAHLSRRALLSLLLALHLSLTRTTNRVGMWTDSMPYSGMHLWFFSICSSLVFKDDSDRIIGAAAIKHTTAKGSAGTQGDISTCTAVRAGDSKHTGQQHCKEIISEQKHASYIILASHLTWSWNQLTTNTVDFILTHPYGYNMFRPLLDLLHINAEFLSN